MVGCCNGARGWFPSNYVKILTDDVIVEDSSKNTTRREYRLSLTFNNTLISDQRQNDDWIAQRTEDGSNIYYFNPCTDETRFEQQEENISNLMTKRLPSLISLVVPEKNPSSIYQQSEYGSTIWSNQSNITLNSMNDDFEQQTCITTEMPKLSSRRLSLIRHTYFHKQPLTWPTISSCIATALQQLVTAAKNNQYHLYAPNAAEIVNIIRFMLISSSTLDKNSPNVKSNAILRTQHHSLIASMAKLVLSTQIPQRFTDKEHQTLINKILVESSELLLAVRNFISTCQTKKIQLVSNELQWIPPSNVQEEHHLPSTLSIHNQRYSLQPNLAENIDTLGTCIQDSAEIIIKFISSIRQETLLHDITSIATRLFTHFQNLSNQTSLFLGYLDETDFSQVEEQYKEDMVELQQGKHKLIDSLGLLLFHLQTLTNTHATNGISDRLKVAKQATGYLFKPIDSICQTVIRLANKSRGTTISRTSLSTTDSIKKINNDQEQHMSHHSTLLSETLERHHSESILPSSKLKQQPTLSGSSSIMQSSQQTAPSKQILYSRRLKKFFGDDTSTVKMTPKGETDPNINSTTTTTTTTIISTVTDMTNDGRPSYLDYDYQPNDIIFNKEGQVKGGTLPALVERLTSHDYLDMKFINTFLLTYRSFCSSIELLNLLKNRYNLVCSPDLTPEESLIWEEKKLKLVRLRVFNVLKNWLELYYYDEDNADQLLDHLLEFTQNHIRTTLKFSNGQLESLIEQRRSEPSGRLKKMILTLPDPPEPILPKPRRRLTLLDIDTLEMARQLTIMDFKLYSAIRPIECLNKAWSREDDTTTVAVNIRASIKYCNQVTSWVSDVILSQQDIKKRSMIIKYWVQVAEKCRILNNFNTCMAILSAFDNSSVGRLRRTWEVVGTRTTATLQQIRKLMGAIRNFVEYRAIIHSINPPCIPFLGIYLQDLTFIEDGNPDELKAKGQPVSLINFAKRAKTAEVIREIQQYQSSLYQLKSVEEIQKFIKSNLISTRDEEQLYKESLKLEPREREDEKITRLLQESGFL
ncbi:ras guanine nucleotide exchange factor domain-containing protein [Cokeromyces recurvatus]|uniref:ras guanine nucleotide exchange factor domain-containing protein n=1 Tax=Cokeromyces recurvatus TaxID=90255 RepID=UPI00221E481A|nr:ras guanine nucleotide exchange factor domain-containing protein [Cokeromyces recurvatus]KAI7905291.1 ras guanine nucleotide exchange factor domain-containing protein [Cokeromyces recurvatus]